MQGYERKELSLIWLDSFSELDYKHKQILIELAGEDFDAKSLVEKCKEYIIAEISAEVYSTLKNSLTVEYIQSVVGELNQKGIRAITCNSKDYPESLINIDHPPLVLYVKGDASLLNSNNLFAVVGSRKSLPVSVGIAKDYVEQLVSASFVMVTGIAEGVDECVIKTTLEKGGKVISVVAGGLDNVYPKTNQKLLDRVAESGLAVSEYPPKTAVMPYMFPIRNRIFAGLSKGVLIVSAGKKSGTLWTANYALEYGKDVFAIPYSIGVSSGEGCNALIKEGANLTDTPNDILEFYGVHNEEKTKIEFTEQERQIINVLSQGEKHINQICSETGKRAFELTPLLSAMEINGYLIKNGNTYQLTRNYSED